MRVSVIIPTLKRPEPLADVVRDLEGQVECAGEVLIIDQELPPDHRSERELENGLTLRILGHAPGVVASRNDAAATATGDVLVFLDDDVRIDSAQFLRTHAQSYADEPTLDAVCGQELVEPEFKTSPPDDSQFKGVYEEAEFFRRSSTARRAVAHLCTCNCSVRRSSFVRASGFDARFTGNSYGDDTDLAIRMAEAGCRIVFVPEASVRHLHWRRGGLRLSDSGNTFTPEDRLRSSWLLYYRHVPAKWRGWFLWDRLLRKSVFLKRNAIRPWKWPREISALLRSRREALASLRNC